MTSPDRAAHPGPVRDFVGYGPQPPDFDWPGGARIAINLVVNYEEGGEYSLGEDGVNDTWGEYSFQYGPEIRDIGTETHMEYGSRVGIWRLCRLIDRHQIPVTFAACALAVERNPPLGEWLRSRDHDVLAHGYHWYGPDAVGMDRDQERDEIGRAVDSLLRTTGRRPRGWMVRSFPTVHTRELLVLREPQAQPRLPARRGEARLRRAADDGRHPRPLERAAGAGLRGPGLHRVRAGPGRRALHATYRRRGVLDQVLPARPGVTGSPRGGPPRSPPRRSGIA